MATDIAGLFGLTPQMYEQGVRQSAMNEGAAYARMAPEDRAIAGIYSAGAGLGRTAGGMLGVEDPQMKLISARQQIMSQTDQSDPKSLASAAKQLNAIGDTQGAMALTDYIRKAQESAGKIALQNAQLLKAMQPAKLTGDERYIENLRIVETKLQNGEKPTLTELSNANISGQMLSKPRSYFDQASGQMVTQAATDPSKAYPLTYKAMSGTTDSSATTVPKPTVQQATGGNLPATSQNDIAEIDANLEKLANSTQLESLSKSLKSGDVKFNAAANAFDFLGAVIPPVFGGQEVGNQVKKDEFTRAITERVNFVLNSAKGVQAKDDAQRAKDQIATPSTFLSSARMQGAIDSLIRAETSLKQELLAKKTALQSQGKTEAPGIPSAKPTEEKPTQPKTTPKPSEKPTGWNKLSVDQKIDRLIQYNKEKQKIDVTREQAREFLRKNNDL